MENSLDDYNGSVPPARRMFGRQRSIHAILGGGKVADVLLWRERRVSSGILIGIAGIWLLIEVVEYNLLSLLCHFTITTMLLIFISSSAAHFFNWNPPNIPEMVLEESCWREVASTFHIKLNQLLSTLLYVGSGHDSKLFLLTIVSLWIISIIGSFISCVNLLFFGTVCLETIPLLYDKYEDEVDNLAYQLITKLKKMSTKFEAEFFEKIPRAPFKDKTY